MNYKLVIIHLHVSRNYTTSRDEITNVTFLF